MDLPDYSTAMREEPTAVCLCGPSGAGKSTVADRLAERDTEIVSTDALRRWLADDASAMEASGVAHQLAYQIIGYRSSHERITIVDSTALDRPARGQIARRVQEARRWLLVCEATLETCLARQKARDREVPNTVVQRQHDKLGSLELEPGRWGRVDVWRSEHDTLEEVADGA